jgi:hypothetical protein
LPSGAAPPARGADFSGDKSLTGDNTSLTPLSLSLLSSMGPLLEVALWLPSQLGSGESPSLLSATTRVVLPNKNAALRCTSGKSSPLLLDMVPRQRPARSCRSIASQKLKLISTDS